MKKQIILYGLISGFISAFWFFLMMAEPKQPVMDFDKGMIMGFSTMGVAFFFVFLGVWKHRKFNGGSLTFGKGFQTGFLIALIASTIYVGVWLITYFYFVTDFSEQYTAHYLKGLKAAGASASKLADEAKQMEAYSIQYKNPMFNALATYMEILPLGTVMALIAALVFKRK